MQKLLLFFAVMCAATGLWAADKPTIKVGVVLPLSGNNAAIGEMARDGLLLRMKELTGNEKFNYKLVMDDDGYVSSRTALAVQRMKSLEKPNVLITLWGTASEVTVPLLKGTEIVHVSADRWIEKTFPHPYDFTYGTHQDLYAKALLTACECLVYKRAAIFYSNASGILMFKRALEKMNQPEKLEIVESMMTNTDTRDLRTWIIKAREAKPDVMINAADMPVAEILMRQMHDLDLKAPTVFISAAGLSVSPEFTNGHWNILAAPPVESFAKRFEMRYKRPANYPAGHLYDTLGLVIKAAETLRGDKVPTAVELSSAIKGLNQYQGVVGLARFTPPNRYDTEAAYFIFKNGKAEPISLEELVKKYKK